MHDQTAKFCPMPMPEGGECGAPVAAHRGPGRPRIFCDDPDHNSGARRRALDHAARVVDDPAARALGLVDRALAAADTVWHIARAAVRSAEKRAMAAEIEAMAARRERDAALGLRDEAAAECHDLRVELGKLRGEVEDLRERVRSGYRVVA